MTRRSAIWSTRRVGHGELHYDCTTTALRLHYDCTTVKFANRSQGAAWKAIWSCRHSLSSREATKLQYIVHQPVSCWRKHGMKTPTGYAPNPMETACLMLLARLGRLLSRHLHLAWPGRAIRNTYGYLERLTDAGLITYVEHFEAPPANRRTRKNPMWKRHGRRIA